MNIYKELGAKNIINLSDTYTRIGGSRMSEETVRYLCEASKYFVDIEVLSKKIGEIIAQKTGNEAAFITSGAASGVVLSVSACMTMGDERKAYALPHTDECEKTEVVIFASQTTNPVLPYWHLIELTGAKLVRVQENIDALNAAITEKTACVFFFAGSLYELHTPPLTSVVEAAKKHGVPLLVDAAAQLPPKSNLTYFTREVGADIAIFSGGKFISGPQSTGLVVGKKELIDRYAALASPNVKIGRPAKIGKEEYMAAYKAITDFIDSDEKARYDHFMEILRRVRDALPVTDALSYEIEPTGRIGQAIPMLYLYFKNRHFCGEKYAQELYELDPAIDIGYYLDVDPTKRENCLFVNPINIHEDEMEYITTQLTRFLLAKCEQ